MKPTKRDIMIVEDFVKKTTKSMMNEAAVTKPIKIGNVTITITDDVVSLSSGNEPITINASIAKKIANYLFRVL